MKKLRRCLATRTPSAIRIAFANYRVNTRSWNRSSKRLPTTRRQRPISTARQRCQKTAMPTFAQWPQKNCPLSASESKHSSSSCRRCCYRAIRVTRTTPILKFEPAPAVTKRPCSLATFYVCTCVMPNTMAGAAKSSMNVKGTMEATRKSSAA